jgi:hypothetical protein
MAVQKVCLKAMTAYQRAHQWALQTAVQRAHQMAMMVHQRARQMEMTARQRAG